MLDTCATAVYVQVDADIRLHPRAVRPFCEQARAAPADPFGRLIDVDLGSFWKRLRQEEVRILVQTEQGVLLLKRPYPPVWEMPGGEIEPGESPAAAAVRETAEETGLDVRLTGLVGTFRRRGWLGGTVYLFRATPIGGRLTATAEAHGLAYFPPGRDIRLMLPWHRPYWRCAHAPPTEDVSVQRVRTGDVLVMVALTIGYQLGLVRDPVHPPGP